MRSTGIVPLFILFLLALPGILPGNAAQNYPRHHPRFGRWQFEIDPDTAVVQFNIGTQEKQLKDAYANARRLKANGIEPSAAQVSHLQVSLLYDYKGGGSEGRGRCNQTCKGER